MNQSQADQASRPDEDDGDQVHIQEFAIDAVNEKVLGDLLEKQQKKLKKYIFLELR